MSKSKEYSGEYISNSYDKLVDSGIEKLIIGITAGRSGIRWLTDIFCAHKNVDGGCERNILAEAFYRYIKWNKLPIDTTGVIEIIKEEIIKDWKNVEISINTSPYLSHDFINLYRELKPYKVIWAINDPIFTLTSFYNKGVYSNKLTRRNHNLVIGFQPVLKDNWHQIFGRLVPTGEFYEEWKSLTQIGKISWFLNTVNLEIYSNLQKIPKTKIWIFRLEEADQNYDYYLKLSEVFNLKPIISKRKFLALKKKTVLNSHNIPKNLSEKERDEFEEQAADYIEIYSKIKPLNEFV